MADDVSRASIALHYAIMAILVAWTVGLGAFVYHGFKPVGDSGAVAVRPHVSTQLPLPM